MTRQPAISGAQGPHRYLNDRIAVYEWFTFDATYDELADDPYALSGRLVWEGDGYRLDSLTVHGVAGGPAVTGDGLRRVRVGEVVALATELVGWSLAPTNRKTMSGEEIRTRGTRDRVALEDIAFLYLLATVTTGAPHLSVMNHLGCSSATAQRWIAAAKRHGYLPAFVGAPGAIAKPPKQKATKRKER
jgi:hypothetical protein